jgi:hypothetical protein
VYAGAIVGVAVGLADGASVGAFVGEAVGVRTNGACTFASGKVVARLVVKAVVLDGFDSKASSWLAFGSDETTE